MAAFVFRVGACFEVLPFLPLFHLSPSLIGLLASEDIKQYSFISSFILYFTSTQYHMAVRWVRTEAGLRA